MRKKHNVEEQEYQHEFAMSFADLMTALVGTFLILLTVFMSNNNSKTEKIINQYNQTLKEFQAVQSLVGIKKNVIEDLKKTFKDSNLDVSIDHETGAIRFSDKIFFDYDSDIISPQGKEFLNKFIPKYMTILLNENTRKNLSEIIIEGHTDSNGTYLYNLDLSQRRALAVAKYILSSEMPNFDEKEYIRQYLTSTGKSFNQPIYENDKLNEELSRRVEFKFRLKEEEAMNEIQKILAK